MSQRIDTLYEEVYYGNCKNEEEEKKAIDELMNILQQFYSLYYGPFHYELYRLRCKLLTLLVLVGKTCFFSSCLLYHVIDLG